MLTDKILGQLKLCSEYPSCNLFLCNFYMLYQNHPKDGEPDLNDQLVCPGCLAQQVLLLDAPGLVIASCLDLPQIWCLRGLQREMHCLLNLKLVSASVKVVPRISDRECPDQKAEVGDWLTGFWCLELQKRNR